MLKEFIDFVEDILPSVDPDLKERASKAIAQFEKEGHQLQYLLFRPLTELSQGDVISHINFMYFEDDGSLKRFQADAMVLSMSCDIDHKDYLLLTPVLPLDTFKGDVIQLKSNMIFNNMYIPGMDNKFVNFEFINSYNKKLLLNGIDNNRIKRIASLNQLGYYLFIVKLTVFLMRKEDEGMLKWRNGSPTM